jgi:hypothetical protein
MTHGDLSILACRWLVKRRRCSRAFAEFNSMKLTEFPDAIGFAFGYQDRGTHVIEVKVSVEDFKRDKSKSWRHFARAGLPAGMGRWRYYLVPEGLVRVEDLPEDHGLLYATASGRVKIVREAPIREVRDVDSELVILSTALQRYELGIPWIASEFRFETETEMKRRTNPMPPSRHVDNEAAKMAGEG